jgi:hypothetical protein
MAAYTLIVAEESCAESYMSARMSSLRFLLVDRDSLISVPQATVNQKVNQPPRNPKYRSFMMAMVSSVDLRGGVFPIGSKDYLVINVANGLPLVGIERRRAPSLSRSPNREHTGNSEVSKKRSSNVHLRQR